MGWLTPYWSNMGWLLFSDAYGISTHFRQQIWGWQPSLVNWGGKLYTTNSLSNMEWLPWIFCNVMHPTLEWHPSHCIYQYGVPTPYCILQYGVRPILPLSIWDVYPILVFTIWGTPHITFINMGCLPLIVFTIWGTSHITFPNMGCLPHIRVTPHIVFCNMGYTHILQKIKGSTPYYNFKYGVN
jgi:hypothetical protein